MEYQIVYDNNYKFRILNFNKVEDFWNTLSLLFISELASHVTDGGVKFVLKTAIERSPANLQKS